MLVIRYAVPSALMKRPSILQNSLVKIPYPVPLPALIRKPESELMAYRHPVTSIVKTTQTPIHQLFTTINHLDKSKFYK